MSEKHPVNKSTPPICFIQKNCLHLLLPLSLRGEPGARKKWLQYLNNLPALTFLLS